MPYDPEPQELANNPLSKRGRGTPADENEAVQNSTERSGSDSAPTTVDFSNRKRMPGIDEPPVSCSQCHDSKIVSTGYHGPPGDDRGSMPCQSCQPAAHSAFLGRGDFIYGASFKDTLDLIKNYPSEDEDE